MLGETRAPETVISISISYIQFQERGHRNGGRGILIVGRVEVGGSDRFWNSVNFFENETYTQLYTKEQVESKIKGKKYLIKKQVKNKDQRKET